MAIVDRRFMVISSRIVEDWLLLSIGILAVLMRDSHLVGDGGRT
jgi:hypothetical protein